MDQLTNELIDTHLIKLVRYCFSNKFILIDSIFDTNGNILDLIKINKELLYLDVTFQDMYANILELIYKSYHLDIVFSPKTVSSLIPNSIYGYKYNKPLAIFRDIPKKKNMTNIDAIISHDKPRIIIPITFWSLTIKLLDWVKFITTKLTNSTIIVLFFFCGRETAELKHEIQKLNIITIDILKSAKIGELLFNAKMISENDFNTIYKFYDETITLPLTIFNKNEYNKLYQRYIELTKTKKTRICVSIEHINTYEETIQYCSVIGNYIAAIKINTNLLYNEAILIGLKKMAVHYNFIIIDDKNIAITDSNSIDKLSYFYNYSDAITIQFSLGLELTNQTNQMTQNNQNNLLTIMDKMKTLVNRHPNASFIINVDKNTSPQVIKRQYDHFRNYIFSISGTNKHYIDMVSMISYKDIYKLNNNFTFMKNCDIILLEDELYEHANPIGVLEKINTICFDS